jgi:hypothetical protein
MKRLILILILTGLFQITASCRLASNSPPSAIVIAVDQFGVNQINCNEDELDSAHSGLAVLCQESVRFTHAYTTSLMSGPALTSVLTGQYPFQHGLRGNQKSFLSSKLVTLAEVAQRQQVATSFFSGGAPILRKLNLQQGFETFDDHFAPSLQRLHRPFSKLQKLFENWFQDVHGRSFLSFFYVPDLAFIQTPTQNDLGEMRNLSYESQLEEFDESLWHFIQYLKERKIWDSTMIILVGLNGPQLDERADELFNTNLYSERTQVGLLIKPAQKPRDEGLSWSFDGNVNLADIGDTLLDLYGTWKSDPQWPLTSLNPVLKSPSAQIQTDRPLLIESSWNEIPNIRSSIRWGQYLFLMDEKPHVFNSLIDKLETTPSRISDPVVLEKWQQIESLRIPPWPGVPPETRIKWKSLAELWNQTSNNGEKSTSFERLAHRLHDDSEISLLYTQQLIRNQSWEDLDRWAQGLHMPDLEKIAQKNLKKDGHRPFQDPCLAATELSQPQMMDLKKCIDPLAFPLLEWMAADRAESADSSQKEALRKKFLRLYVLNAIDQKISEMNLGLQAIWDISPSLRRPQLTTEMMLALPEMQKYKLAAQKALLQSQDEALEP